MADDHYTGPAKFTDKGSSDATTVPGQNPTSVFGATVPYSTGAPGSSPAAGATDATNQPGQYPAHEHISGVALDGTGAPGSVFSDPGQGDEGTVVTDNFNDSPIAGGFAYTPGTGQTATSPPGTYPDRHPLTGTPLPQGTGAGQGRENA